MCPKVTELHKNEVRERILHAAMGSFAQTGYDKTKMDDIAKRLGLSKGTLYLYFKSKEDLYDSLVLDGFTQVVQRLAELAQQEEPACWRKHRIEHNERDLCR